MKFVLIASIAYLLVVLTSAAKIKIKSKPNVNADLFKDSDFTFSQDAEDGKEATIFKGDVMKAKAMITQNNRMGTDFKYATQTNNGIEIEQVGKLKADGKTFVVQGSYSYTGADNRRYRVRYTADERGYHPITELEIDIPDPVTGEKIYKPLEPFKFPKFDFKKTTVKPKAVNPFAALNTGPKLGSRFGIGDGDLNNKYLPPSNKYLPAKGPNTVSRNELPNDEYLPPF